MKIKHFIIFLPLLMMANCASEADSNLENAQFALDEGDYDRAIELATDAIAEDSSNIAAYRLLGSALFGRSGVDFLDMTEAILDLGDDAEANFLAIANALPADGSSDDLRAAIAALETAPGITDETITDEELADTAFDMAFMKAIEHYSLGVYGSTFHTDLDVTQITDEQAAQAQDNLVDFDNNFVASGVDETEDFLSEIRQTFCILEGITAAEGFTTAEYQALVGCQLDPDDFDPTTVTADVASCAALEPVDGDACYDTDTSL